MRRILALTAAAVLGLTGCSTSDAANDTTDPARVAPTAKTRDAGTLIKALKAAGLPIANIQVQDEDTDPNNLLGRPNGYLSRASGDLPGGDTSADKGGVERGLVIETFPDAAGAKRRYDYIQGLQKDMPILGAEWGYFGNGSRALVRVSGKVKPSLAKKVEAAVAAV